MAVEKQTRYSLVNEDDPHWVIELEATNLEEAAFEALARLGWMLVDNDDDDEEEECDET